MSISAQTFCVAVVATFVGAILPAHADLAIAKRPTQNVSCTGGSCVATAAHAVMNAADLRHLLAAQAAVSVDAGPAKNIVVDTALSWANGHALSLTATARLSVNQPITVVSKAAVAINSASMVFAPKASLTFWDKTSALTINGSAYVLVGDLTGLSQAVPCYNTCFVAFVNDYDAATDQHFSEIVSSQAVVEGLGHTISNIKPSDGTGLMGVNNGRISNIHLENVQASEIEDDPGAGLVADINSGIIDHVSATGSIPLGHVPSGGLVGINNATVSHSHAKAKIQGLFVGGLVGLNGGTIDSSYAEGSVGAPAFGVGSRIAGGLVGVQRGIGRGYAVHITNSYSTANVAADFDGGFFGGLIGYTSYSAVVQNSYAAGTIHHQSGTVRGGVIGDDVPQIPQTSFTNTYWDFVSGVNNPARGAGNVANVPGITGLTDAQLKSGLPAGFDPKVWAQSPSINNGYPYLIANPPQ